MPRLLLIAAALAAALVPAGSMAAPSRDAGPVRPNFIVVMTDDQTVRDMSAMPRTRRLIGGAGATFTRSYVSYPLCCPSRATFLTGQYAHNHGVRSTAPPSGGFEALSREHTLPIWLQRAGYETIHIGKYLNGYGLRRAPTVPPGWSDWHASVDKSTYQMWGYTLFENGQPVTYGDFDVEDPRLYQTDVFGAKAVAAIESRANDRDPYFLSLAFVAPHGESVAPGQSTQPYLRPAPRHEGLLANKQLPSAMLSEDDVSDKPPYVRRLPRPGPYMRARIREDFRARRESLLAVDDAVAAVVAALERTGQLERTYILFTSDNGFLQGEHRIPKGKYFAYDPATHVPLLLRGPGIAPGTVSDQLVANTDLAPTVLHAAGAAADIPLDGMSLLPFAGNPSLRLQRTVLHEGLVNGDTDRDDPEAAARTWGPGAYYAARTDRFLYVKWRGGARELYDLELDPRQLQSRHRDPQYAGVRRLLSDQVARLRRCVGLDCLRPLPGLRTATRRLPRS